MRGSVPDGNVGMGVGTGNDIFVLVCVFCKSVSAVGNKARRETDNFERDADAGRQDECEDQRR